MLRLGIDAGHGEHALAGGPQDLVLRNVDGELVVTNFQRQRKAMVAVQLLTLAQPASQYLGTLLDDDVAGEQALMYRALGLPPQRLGDGRYQVGGLGHRHGLGPPRGAMLGVADEEQQPGDVDLRLDMDLKVADPRRADLPCWPDLPEPRTVGRRRGGDDTGTGERPALLRRE